MRRSSQFLVSIALIAAFGVCAHAEPIVPDEVTKQLITQPLDTTTINDYLLDMARVTNINVVADATNFPAESVKPYPSTPGAIAGQVGERREFWKPFLINVMGDFVAQEKFSTLRADARTFLFWNEPDPLQMSKLQLDLAKANELALFAQAVAAAKEDGVPEAEIISGELSDDQLRSVLYAYLEEHFGWTGTVAQRTNNVDLRVRFDDLPLEIQALALLSLRKQVLDESQSFITRTDFSGVANFKVRAQQTEEGTVLDFQYDTSVSPDGNSRISSGYKWTVPRSAATIPANTGLEAVVTPENLLAQARLEPRDTVANAYSGLSNEVPVLPLDADAKLQTNISLQAKRLPLRELLTQLEQQSDVHFSIGEAAPADKLVTMRVEQMPLLQLMGVLARVYGVKWSKNADAAYVMRGNDQGELHLKLLQMGDLNEYRYRFMFYNRADREDEPVAIGRAIIDRVGVEALQAPEGVAFATLPTDLKNRLWFFLQYSDAEYNAVIFRKMNPALAEQLQKHDLVLRFGNSVSKSYTSPYMRPVVMEPKGAGTLIFNVQSDDGRMIMPVFQSFMLFEATPGEQDERPRSRRR